MKLFLIVSILSLLPMATFAADVTPAAEQEYEVNIDGDDVNVQEHYNYNFGRVRVGNSESATFTLRNRGRIPVYINDIDLDGDNAFHENDNCPRLLLRGQGCRIRVRFRPMDTGRYQAELNIELTGASDIEIDLRGRGVRRGGIDF
ncbi:choice-of-anchor D domain-containing protein [Bdellovibrio sp. HCB2-146]|uniref:choice-of-anchor D domain-containing protein n=1 Tax=Bdellovibrio sp. HCB2-146 TaxID=3394362 RepID=UPI0039BD7029